MFVLIYLYFVLMEALLDCVILMMVVRYLSYFTRVSMFKVCFLKQNISCLRCACQTFQLHAALYKPTCCVGKMGVIGPYERNMTQM